MSTLHLISHTHWDREWYLPFQVFRLKLVHLIDRLLDILENDPEFHSFLLDGQTILLNDYLSIRPEREEQIKRLVQAGRLFIGPWHVLADEFLVSPEALIRNLLEGDRICQRFGSKMEVGYIPDPFGHIAQMPQILVGFGIHFASVQRGLDDHPCEMWWEAPNGFKVLMAYLRDGYGNAASLSTDNLDSFLERVTGLRDSLLPYTATSHLLLMHGTDHTEPQPHVSQAIRIANQSLKEDSLVHSNFPAYFSATEGEIHNQRVTLPTVRGELRSSKRHHLLPGVLSTRIWIKQRNHACETLLEKWAEPFGLLSEKISSRDQIVDHGSTQLRNKSEILHHAWRLLLECQPHDSICGCSIDQVHREMQTRFDQVEQMGEEITRSSLETIAEGICTLPPQDRETLPTNEQPSAQENHPSYRNTAILVFNPNTIPCTFPVTVTIPGRTQTSEIIDGSGLTTPSQVVHTQRELLMDDVLDRQGLLSLISGMTDGKVTGLARPGLMIQDIVLARLDDQVDIHVFLSNFGEPDTTALERVAPEMATYLMDTTLNKFHLIAEVLTSQVRFLASDIPPLGYKTYLLQSASSTASSLPQHLSPIAYPIQHLSTSAPQISNEFFSVEVASDGTLTLTDLRSGISYPGLNRFWDGGDCGDEYNYCPPATDDIIQATLYSVKLTNHPIENSLRVEFELPTPKCLLPDRKKRSSKTVTTRIITTASLIPGVPRLDIHTQIENQADDHRLRVHFPTPFFASYADYDSHFAIIRRPICLPNFDSTWIEQPRPEKPQRNFTAVSNGSDGLLIANRGLREIEVFLNESEAAEFALTLLRCVGWLSRNDLMARKGHAGPEIATPEAQMHGTWNFDYSIIPFRVDQTIDAYQQAYVFNSPPRAVITGLHEGDLPNLASFIRIQPSNFILSAVKEAENRDGWILRGYSICDQPIQVQIKTWTTFHHISLVNLKEALIEPLTPEPNGEINFTAKPYTIVTLKLSDPRE